MKSLVHYTLLTLSVLAITSCDLGKKFNKAVNTEVKIDGQMFVIKNDRTNVKLGDVEIYVVPKSKLMASMPDYKLRYDCALEIEKLLGHDNKTLDSFKEATEDLESFARILNIQESKAIEEICSKMTAEHEEAESQLNQIALKAPFVRSSDPAYLTLFGTIYGDLSNLSIAKTKTDADGNFTLTINTDEAVYLIARSKRYISGQGDIEYYHWIHEVANPQERHLLTSNNTLSSSSMKILLLDSGYPNELRNDRIKKIYTVGEQMKKIQTLIAQSQQLRLDLESIKEVGFKYATNEEALRKVNAELENTENQLKAIGAEGF